MYPPPVPTLYYGSLSLSVKILFHHRHKGDVFLEVVSALVMLTVCETPRMERHEEERVDGQSNGVVEALAFGEGTMPAFMCELPQARKDEALREGINNPSSIPQVWGRDVVDLRAQRHQRAHESEIAQHVEQGEESIRTEAMRRNGVVDLLHGVLRGRPYRGGEDPGFSLVGRGRHLLAGDFPI